MHHLPEQVIFDEFKLASDSSKRPKSYCVTKMRSNKVAGEVLFAGNSTEKKFDKIELSQVAKIKCLQTRKNLK